MSADPNQSLEDEEPEENGSDEPAPKKLKLELEESEESHSDEHATSNSAEEDLSVDSNLAENPDEWSMVDYKALQQTIQAKILRLQKYKLAKQCIGKVSWDFCCQPWCPEIKIQ